MTEETGSPSATPPPPRPEKSRLKPVRYAYAALGIICVGLGGIGVFVPGMPTTIFLIIALWSFARSSDRLHDWLYYHPRFGPFLSNWSRHGTINRKAKWYAGLSIVASYAITLLLSPSIVFSAVVAAILLVVIAYIVTRPEMPANDRHED